MHTSLNLMFAACTLAASAFKFIAESRSRSSLSPNSLTSFTARMERGSPKVCSRKAFVSGVGVRLVLIKGLAAG